MIHFGCQSMGLRPSQIDKNWHYISSCNELAGSWSFNCKYSPHEGILQPFRANWYHCFLINKVCENIWILIQKYSFSQWTSMDRYLWRNYNKRLLKNYFRIFITLYKSYACCASELRKVRLQNVKSKSLTVVLSLSSSKNSYIISRLSLSLSLSETRLLYL